ncbi:HNH endonuclease [Effusibacillus dendaii]|uniref:HNH endonuclease n=1 Tax=Effusibacillus dendaii TaxID=2743772 RepID=UPI001909CF2A|nr:HNH endonuclease [Effusibacillus dendaii]
MPCRPKKPCSHPRCPELTTERYCDTHRKQEHRSYKQRRTDKEEQAFYNSKEWRVLRSMKLRRDPLCEECQRQGRLIPAVLVDHIQPIKQGGARLDMDNLQSLCRACHNAKTAAERG